MPPTKILIVEDERITAEDIQDILVDFGYTVVGIASTAVEALRQAEQFMPDLALMDIQIEGDMDGIETAKMLRERFDIPVVYLTAHSDIETLQRAKYGGPLQYVVKPFQDLELRTTIEIAMQARAVSRRARQSVIGQSVATVVLTGVVVAVLGTAACAARYVGVYAT